MTTVHVTRITNGDVYGHTTDHCDPSGCAGDEHYFSALITRRPARGAIMTFAKMITTSGRKLVWVRDRNGEFAHVRKFRAVSKRWTGLMKVPTADLLPIDESMMDLVRRADKVLL